MKADLKRVINFLVIVTTIIAVLVITDSSIHSLIILRQYNLQNETVHKAMYRTICYGLLLLVSINFSCSKKEAIDLSAPTKEVTVSSGMDYYVEQTQGKWIWQVYLEFDQIVSNASGNATIEFVTYKHKKHDKRQTLNVDWSIPSDTKSKNFVLNTNWTTYDFDDVDSVKLKSINCTSGGYHFKIK